MDYELDYIYKLPEGQQKTKSAELSKILRRIFASMLTPEGTELNAIKKILQDGPNGETAKYKNTFPILFQFYSIADDYEINWKRLEKLALDVRDGRVGADKFISVLTDLCNRMNNLLGDYKFELPANTY